MEKGVAAKKMVDDLAKLENSFIIAWLDGNKADVTYANNAGDALGIYNSKISQFHPTAVFDAKGNTLWHCCGISGDLFDEHFS